MTKLLIPYESDFRAIRLEERSVIGAGNELEFVFSTFYNEDRLVRFWTAKRNGNGIRETHYSVNPETGGAHLDSVGVCGEDIQQKRYSELNEFLESCKRSSIGYTEVK